MKNVKFIYYLFAVIPYFSCSQVQHTSNPGPIVASDTTAIAITTAGKIIGYMDDGIYVFKGVPYAKAERFMPPEKPDSWDNVRQCRIFGPSTPQVTSNGLNWNGQDESGFIFNFNLEPEDEKELYCLNVWTQGLDDGKKRPVFVWYHGGGYFAGSANSLDCYQGLSLAKKGDIIVVTVNHRLNVLGFTDLSACGEKYAKSANVSVLDMVASLEWIHDNIERFGGDPNNVTIAGQSGGGGKVQTLMVTPAAKGLFNKAIVQSGAFMGLATLTKEQTQAFGLALLKELNIEKEDVDKIADVPLNELISAAKRVSVQTSNGMRLSTMNLGPSIDGSVMPYDFFDPAASDLYKDIPLLIGSTFNEFSRLRYGEEITMDEAKEQLKERYGEDTDKFTEAFVKAYPKGSPQDMLSIDLNVRAGTLGRSAQKYNQGSAPVYVYLFNWKSQVLNGRYSACHNMEIPFMFNNVALARELTGSTEDAYVLEDKVSGAWINFTKTGIPNADGLPKWDAFAPETNATMIFDTQCEHKINHDKELLEIAVKHPINFGMNRPATDAE